MTSDLRAFYTAVGLSPILLAAATQQFDHEPGSCSVVLVGPQQPSEYLVSRPTATMLANAMVIGGAANEVSVTTTSILLAQLSTADTWVHRHVVNRPPAGVSPIDLFARWMDPTTLSTAQLDAARRLGGPRATRTVIDDTTADVLADAAAQVIPMMADQTSLVRLSTMPRSTCQLICSFGRDSSPP